MHAEAMPGICSAQLSLSWVERAAMANGGRVAAATPPH